MKLLRPGDTQELAAIVSEAAASRSFLHVLGSGSKARLGNISPIDPAISNAVHLKLDLSNFSGVVFYEPEELVLCAKAATPMAEIEDLLAAQGQELAFEPMSYQPLFGTDQGSLGGVYMTNQSGPRRLKSGAARDHVLGVKAVSGRGEVFKAGGRVVKNVTGFDLSRGLAGSFGTLSIATEITFKVLPRAETSASLVISNLTSERAIALLCAAMGAPVDVSGAAHLEVFAAEKLGYNSALTVLRLEGFAPSVNARFDRLARLLAEYGKTERLGCASSSHLWRAIRDVEPLVEPIDKIIWKLSVTPTSAPQVLEDIREAVTAEAMFDWSGGLLWLALDQNPDASAAIVRRAVARNGGGHATLVRAPEQCRKEIPVFEPQSGPLARLTQRLKAQFDPSGILEPHRMSLDTQNAN